MDSRMHTTVAPEPLVQSARVSLIVTIVLALLLPTGATAQSANVSVRMGQIRRGVALGRLVVDVVRSSRSAGPHAGSGSRSGSGAKPNSKPGSATTGSSARTARLVIHSGEQLLGVPYVWGGSSTRGFDCSGFVQYVFREHGVELPRTSRQMARAGRSLRARVSELSEGDLMLFTDDRTGGIGHVAIYAGGNRILHSSSSGHGVRYDDLSGSRGRYFLDHFVAARRVTEGGVSLVDPLMLSSGTKGTTVPDAPDGAPSAPNPWAR